MLIRRSIQTKLLYEGAEGMYEALEKGNLETLREILCTLFSGISYDWLIKNKPERFEGHYASVVYAFFGSLELDMKAEDYTNKGRIDLVINYEDKVYILEFKMMEKGRETSKAFLNLKEKWYAENYLGKAREIYLKGIDFDP